MVEKELNDDTVVDGNVEDIDDDNEPVDDDVDGRGELVVNTVNVDGIEVNDDDDDDDDVVVDDSDANAVVVVVDDVVIVVDDVVDGPPHLYMLSQSHGAEHFEKQFWSGIEYEYKWLQYLTKNTTNN